MFSRTVQVVCTARVNISTVRVTECYWKSQCGFPVPTGGTSRAIRRQLVSSRKLLHVPGSTEEDRQRQRHDKYKTHLRQSHSLSAHFLLHSDVNTSLFGKNTDIGDRQ